MSCVFNRFCAGTADATKRAMIRIILLLWALAALVPAQATTLSRASLDDLIQTSTSIVRGKVIGSYTAARGNLIYTHYTVQVTDRWKGRGTAQVDVQVPGGSWQGLQQNIAGAPQLTEGSEYVFFLWNGPSGANHLLGLSQGVLDVTTDGAGNLIVVRQASQTVMLNPNAAATPGQDTLQMKLSDFKIRVTGALNGSGAPK